MSKSHNFKGPIVCSNANTQITNAPIKPNSKHNSFPLGVGIILRDINVKISANIKYNSALRMCNP